MEIVNLREGYNFKLLLNKTLVIQTGIENVFYCPFCYCKTEESENKCSSCNKNFPQVIYYHGDDDTWIASGNEE